MTFILCDLLDVTVVLENTTTSFPEKRSITHNILLSFKCLSDYVYTAKSQVEIQFTWFIELIFRQPRKDNSQSNFAYFDQLHLYVNYLIFICLFIDLLYSFIIHMKFGDFGHKLSFILSCTFPLHLSSFHMCVGLFLLALSIQQLLSLC